MTKIQFNPVLSWDVIKTQQPGELLRLCVDSEVITYQLFDCCGGNVDSLMHVGRNEDVIVGYWWSDDRDELSVAASFHGFMEVCTVPARIIVNTDRKLALALLDCYSNHVVKRVKNTAERWSVPARSSDDDVQKMRVLLAQLVELDWCIGYGLTAGPACRAGQHPHPSSRIA